MRIAIMTFILMGGMLAAAAFAMGAGPNVPDIICAEFETSQGDFTCLLYHESAPKTVANFVELARGEKEWTYPSSGEKVKTPIYNGTIFHRVIKGFMIQGGDPLGTGFGGPGYQFADEIDPALTFDNPGTLAMANSGPNTNGSQFFITVAPTPWLNGKHTIFGRVIKGYEVVKKISEVPTDKYDRPLQHVVIENISINCEDIEKDQEKKGGGLIPFLSF